MYLDDMISTKKNIFKKKSVALGIIVFPGPSLKRVTGAKSGGINPIKTEDCINKLIRTTFGVKE